jgi:lipopolysaccharide transport system ATP-binding protein
MSDAAVRLDGLSKRYRIGVQAERPDTFLGATLGQTFSFVRNWKKIRNLTHFDADQNGDDVIWALKDISFDVRQGEKVGIIGQNGAGKSTLLKVISRITAPTSGTVTIQGRCASLLEVGTGFHPELTGRENIYLNGTILGMSRAEIKRKFDEIVDFSGVEKFIDTPVKRYSSGMRVRLAFSVAVNLDAEVMIIDEVLSVGDAEFQKKSLKKMEDVGRQGRTVLFVSHNMYGIRRLCERAVLLQDGQVAKIGTADEVVEHYMGGDTDSVSERVWSDPALAPGNELVSLRRVAATNPAGATSGEFMVTDPVDVEVEFAVLASGHKINASFYFYDDMGSLIFVAGDYQNDEWKGRDRPQGIHVSRCRIPANLLNAGRMSVRPWIFTEEPHQVHASSHDALVLNIKDNVEVGGSRGYIKREWPGGAVRPVLEWTSSFEPSKSGFGHRS